MDYTISNALCTLATFKVKEQQEENWPEPVTANDADKFVGEYDEDAEREMIPTIKKAPFIDPLEDPTLISNDPTKPIDQLIVPTDIGSMYLLNPLSIMSCVAQSSQIFSNMGVALALMYASKGSRVFSMFWLAFASYFSLYPMFLVAPCVLLIEKSTQESVFQSNIVEIS
jgi:hypothetical protein